MRPASFSLLGFLAMTGIAACGSDEPAVERIVIYTAIEPDQATHYLQIFSAEVPNVQIELVRDSTGVITDRLLAEKDAPLADVVWGLAATSLLLPELRPSLEPYRPAGLDRVKARYRDAANPPLWVGTDVFMSALCINYPQLDKDSVPYPTSWADLTNPIYRGRIAMPNPQYSGTGFLAVSGLVQKLMEDPAFTYMDALHQNVAVYTRSGSRPCALAKEGTYPIGISFDSAAVDGTPALAAVFPSDGSFWDLEANALVKKPAIKAGARRFLDWAISDAAMREYARNFGVTAVDTGAPVPAGFPASPESLLIENDLAKAAGDRSRLIMKWTEKYGAKTEPGT